MTFQRKSVNEINRHLAAIFGDMNNRQAGEEEDGHDQEENNPTTSSRRPESVPEGGDPPPEMYKESETLFENSQYSISVQESKFKRQKQFDLYNRLYRIKATTKRSQKNPLLLDVMEIFRQTLEKVIDKIQSAYTQDADKFRQIYLTIHDGAYMSSGINTVNVSLKEDRNVIIDKCLNQFFIFLQSHKEAVLTNTFQIDIKILSLQHVSHRHKNQPHLSIALPREEPLIGAYSYVSCRKSKQRWLFRFGNGFVDHPLAFLTKCLLVAVILGAHRKKFLSNPFDGDGHHFVEMCEINSTSIYLERRAGVAILKVC